MSGRGQVLQAQEATGEVLARDRNNSGDRKLRVLLVHTPFAFGGIELWIRNALGTMDTSPFELHVFTAEIDPAHRAAVEAVGGTVLLGPKPRQILAYLRALRKILANSGGYDIVHCNFLDQSGLVLREAHRAGVPVRIAHSHADRKPLRRSWWRECYFSLSQALVRRHATAGFAASRAAAAYLYGDGWESDGRWRVLLCGIDLTRFEKSAPAFRPREELGCAESSFVVGHLGRFDEQKNHTFLLDVVRSTAERIPDVVFLFIGEGPLESEIRARAEGAGLARHIRFVGTRNDVPALMHHAMDAFVFPSVYEGLGLAVVEAQAAGLPCVISANVPGEATVVPELVTSLGIQPRSVPLWADALTEICHARRPMTTDEALARVKASPHNLKTTAVELQQAYLKLGSEAGLLSR